MIGKVLAGGIAVVLVVPAVAVLAAFGIGADAQMCISSVVASANPDQMLPDNQPEDPNPTFEPQVTAPASAASNDGATSASAGVAPGDSASDDPAANGCLPALGIGTVEVPPGTPVDVATAVHNALAYVGVK